MVGVGLYRLCVDTSATEGSVCRAHILTALSVVFLNAGSQIFFQPSTVSTELTLSLFFFFDLADRF